MKIKENAFVKKKISSENFFSFRISDFKLYNKFSFIKTHQQITRSLFMDTLTERISRINSFLLFHKTMMLECYARDIVLWKKFKERTRKKILIILFSSLKKKLVRSQFFVKFSRSRLFPFKLNYLG